MELGPRLEWRRPEVAVAISSRKVVASVDLAAVEGAEGAAAVEAAAPDSEADVVVVLVAAADPVDRAVQRVDPVGRAAIASPT